MGRDREWLAVAAIVAVGAALRVGPLGEFWLNGDEGLYYYIAHAPYELARVPMEHNAHPPGYFWLLRGAALLGNDFLWLRAPSLVAGVATIYAMFLLGREVAGRPGAFTAAALTALAPAAVSLSQVARQYALLDLLLAVAALCFLRFLRTRRPRDLAGYTACLVAALFVQYGAFVLPAAVALLTLGLFAAGRIDRRTAGRIAVAHLPLAVAAAFLYGVQIRPNLVGQPMQREAVHGWLSQSFAGDPVGILHSFLGFFEYLAGPRFGIAALLACLAGLGVCAGSRRPAVAGLTLAALAISVVLSAAGLYPFGATRHSFHLAPLVALPLAVGVGWIADRGRRAALPAVLAGSGIVLATGPLGSWPGLFGARPAGVPELVIPRREIAELEPIFRGLYRSAGVTVTDLESVYTLSPLMRAAEAWPRWFGAPPTAVYPYGRQLVVAAPVWHVTGALGARRSPRQLAGVLRAIEAELPEAGARLGQGVTVISTDGGRVLRTIKSAGDGERGDAPMVEVIVASPHLSVFQLDVSQYRATLDARRRSIRREQLRKALGRD